MIESSFLNTISDVSKIITPIDSTVRFPEILEVLLEKYSVHIDLFCQIISESDSSEDILRQIRIPSRSSDERMALLKMYRRCVAPVLDTETTKKIKKINTEMLIDTYGSTFKPIAKLQKQFLNFPQEHKFALAALIGEYDTRGQLGYQLTEMFFDWFEASFLQNYTINGPRGAGKDIELSEIYPNYKGDYPCDFVIKRKNNNDVMAIGFARYDSTRGGAQSDDRTGGNSNKVDKVKQFSQLANSKLKIIFLSDGPGLMHKDTWKEACILDGQWNDRVRVITLKLASKRLTKEWLES